MDKEELKKRVINGLYAQAVCDAVGDPFEFRTNINPKDVSNFAKKAARLTITDDTQMALFGFEAVERASRMSGNMEDRIRQSFTTAYIDWFYTQNYNDIQNRGLLQFESLYHQRAPGNTCLNACNTLRVGGKVENDSKGCGSVMRLLPAMVFEDFIDSLACASISARITHHHEENQEAVRDYIEAAYMGLAQGNLDYLVGNSYVGHISELGEGWTAQECVDMAIFAVQRAQTFDELLEISIAHDGDSDSVGAVAGSLWGLSGREVPQEYIDKLVELPVIEYCIQTYILPSR